jgi:hypothetical protein
MTQTQNANPVLDLRAIVDLEAWQDPRFKDEVQRDPAAAVAKLAKKYGMPVPAGISFRTVSDEDTVYHLVISNNPAGLAPSDDGSEIKGYIQSNTPALGAASQPAAFFSSTTCGWFCNPHICKLGSQGPLCRVSANQG